MPFDRVYSENLCIFKTLFSEEVSVLRFFVKHFFPVHFTGLITQMKISSL